MLNLANKFNKKRKAFNRGKKPIASEPVQVVLAIEKLCPEKAQGKELLVLAIQKDFCPPQNTTQMRDAPQYRKFERPIPHFRPSE